MRSQGEITQTKSVSRPCSCTGEGAVPIKGGSILDVDNEVKELAKSYARERDPTQFSVRQCAEDAMVDIEAKYSGRTLSMPGKTNVLEAARRARRVEAQDWETAIWAYPLVACLNETRPFVQFCITVPVESRTSPHGYSVGKIVGFAHPRALHIACEASRHWFIDGTFFVVPVGFYQLIILMIFIPGYKLAIPIWYILVPDKKGATYHMALGMAQGVSEHYGRMKASTFTCDFEEALIKCLIILFCMGVLVGCLFHLKQAIRGKLTKTFGFDKNDPIIVQV